MIFKFILSCLGCISMLCTFSQEIVSNSNRERNFAFEVKHIDEFLERFNNEKDAFITKYVRDNYPGVSVDRKSLLAHLVNRQKNNWHKEEINTFFTQVSNLEHPVYLDFYNGNWYAEALARFKYNGRLIDVVIILKIQQDANGGSKWLIVSAYSSLIARARSNINVLAKSGNMKFLNPMSHATNFMSLAMAMHDNENIRDYLDDTFFKSHLSKDFLYALLRNQLRFQFVKKITYHFLQVDGWLFTVEHFPRASVNSGWLISNLKRGSDQDKKAYLDSLFRLNL